MIATLFFVLFLLVATLYGVDLVVIALAWRRGYKWQRIRRRIEQSHVPEEVKSRLLMRVFKLELEEIEGKKR